MVTPESRKLIESDESPSAKLELTVGNIEIIGAKTAIIFKISFFIFWIREIRFSLLTLPEEHAVPSEEQSGIVALRIRGACHQQVAPILNSKSALGSGLFAILSSHKNRYREYCIPRRPCHNWRDETQRHR